MNLPFKGTGKIVYDPFRAGMKARTDWWAVIEVDKEITRHARWWLNRRYHLQLDAPAWDAHISVIRGEKPKPELMHLWKKYHGQRVEFRYGLDTYKSEQADGKHFWLIDVECPIVGDIRKELERPYDWAPHITVARERA